MRLLLILVAMVGTAFAATPLDLVRDAEHQTPVLVPLSGLNESAAYGIAAMNTPLGPSHYTWGPQAATQTTPEGGIPATLTMFSTSKNPIPANVKNNTSE
jgi:hypothetical protein